MNPIVSSKRMLREQFRERRRALSSEERACAEEHLLTCIEAWPPAVSVIAAYEPMSDEVNVLPAIHMLEQQGHCVVVPHVLSPGCMQFVHRETRALVEHIDVMWVPGVAFTHDGARLGLGGGYYDRYLQAHRVYCIGIAFDCQRAAALPVEAHDYQLNEVWFLPTRK